MRTPATLVSAALMGALTGSVVAVGMDLSPGLYEVSITLALPNVPDVPLPTITDHCVTSADLQSGRAFFVLSDNPLNACDLVDYQLTGNTASYRVLCPGPNRGSAIALFETTSHGYRGTIKMNMGGKNMTMSETQVAKRIGECR